MVSVYFRYPQGGIDPSLVNEHAAMTKVTRNEQNLPGARIEEFIDGSSSNENIIVASPDGQNTIINEVKGPYRKGRGGQIYTTDSNSQDIFDGVNRYNNVHFPSRTSNRQEKLNYRNSRSTHKTMKNNAKMRKDRRIQQPGHDVQRFGGK